MRDRREAEFEEDGDARQGRRGFRPRAFADALSEGVARCWRWAMQRRPFGPVGIAGLPIILGVTLGAAGSAFPPTRDAALAFYDSMRHAVLSRPEYRIRWVMVEGAPRVSEADIVAALDLAPEERAALGFDAREARRRVESLGWVKTAAVFVRPPQTLEIRIEQRVPAVVWRRDRRLSLLDRSGALIADIENRGDWAELPLIVGQAAPAALEEGLALREAATAAGLGVAALTRVGGRRWDIALEGGLRVMLPEADPHRALDDVIAWAQRADLLQRNFEVLDLRIAFAPSARLRHDAPPEPRAESATGGAAAAAAESPRTDG